MCCTNISVIIIIHNCIYFSHHWPHISPPVFHSLLPFYYHFTLPISIYHVWIKCRNMQFGYLNYMHIFPCDCLPLHMQEHLVRSYSFASCHDCASYAAIDDCISRDIHDCNYSILADGQLRLRSEGRSHSSQSVLSLKVFYCSDKVLTIRSIKVFNGR